MKLENQVCSLELAQKLKILGVKQESYFVWQSKTGDAKLQRDMHIVPTKDMIRYIYCSAFTCSELGEMLPSYIQHSQHGQIYLYTYKDDAGMWRVTYSSWGMMKEFEIDKYENEADARASMLIYLLKNNLITP